MKCRLIPVFGCVLLLSGWHASPANAQNTAQSHVARAKAAAYTPGHDFTGVLDRLCVAPAPGQTGARPAERNPLPLPTAERSEWFVEPVKIFDNLYYIGSKDDSSWAVTTSAGIIVIDTGYQYSIEELAADGLKKLGLDPANIKYVIVSHAHSDHYLGAKFLQDRYNARIILSEADWNVIANDYYPASAKPKKDMVATDGMKLTLGDTTLTLYITPGHTPGTISTLIPLKDGNQTHLGSIWGGMTFGFERAGVRYFPTLVDALRTNAAQARRYQAIAERAGADAFISIHAFHDKTHEKIAAVKARQPGAVHPFVNKEAIKRHLTVIAECSLAQVAWRQGASQ
jgi:metallo-beta-lactamase class B